MIRLLFQFVALFTDTALAVDPPEVDCEAIGLPSCGGGGNILAESIVPVIAVGTIQMTVACALLFVLYAGLQLVLAQGDEGKIEKARKAIVYALGGLALTLMSQNIYSFFATNDFTGDPENAIFDIIIQSMATMIVKVFNPIFILAIILAAIRMVLDRGKEDEFKRARTAILWACAGAIVINVAYALVKAVIDIFTV